VVKGVEVLCIVVLSLLLLVMDSLIFLLVALSLLAFAFGSEHFCIHSNNILILFAAVLAW
jgi:hypothetical protein